MNKQSEEYKFLERRVVVLRGQDLFGTAEIPVYLEMRLVLELGELRVIWYRWWMTTTSKERVFPGQPKTVKKGNSPLYYTRLKTLKRRSLFLKVLL